MRRSEVPFYCLLLLAVACSHQAAPPAMPHFCGNPACIPGQTFDLTTVTRYSSNAYSRLASADLNGDGMLDLVGLLAVTDTSGIDVLLGQIDGGLSGPYHYEGLGGIAVALGDLDGDGFADVVGSGPGGVVVLFNGGNGSFYDQLHIELALDNDAEPLDVAIGDLNGDGRPDIVTSGYLGVDIIFNQGARSFAPPVKLLLADAGSGLLTVADFNGDGLADIAVNLRTPEIFLSLRDGGFESPSQPSGLEGGESFYALVPLACMNAAPDLVGISVGSYGSGSFEGVNVPAVMTLYNDGSGRFRRGEMYSPHSDSDSWLAVGDFNGDCIEDVIVDGVETCDGGPGMGVLFGDGDAGFLPPVRLNTAGPGAQSLAPIGAVGSPRALALLAPCGAGITVLGNASKQ
jgi:hypothetical protein